MLLKHYINVSYVFNCNVLRFYSVIAPGDTVNVIGEFDVKGKCYVDRHHNFLIVHPDVLVSGTRVMFLSGRNIGPLSLLLQFTKF